MEVADIKKAIMLGNIIKGIYRQLILGTTIGAIFFSLYISMHQQSTASTFSQYEYWIIFTIFWMSMFVFGIGVVKGQQYTQLFLMFSLLMLIAFFSYDCYMISLLTGPHHHTYLITTLIIRWIFWVLEVVFIVVIFGALSFSQQVWTIYITMLKYYNVYDVFDRYNFNNFEENEDEDEDKDKQRNLLEKTIKEELMGSYHRSTLKDDVVLGVIYTTLPIETSALFFFILTILSVDNATRSDWLYIIHILTIVVSAVWSQHRHK